MVDTLRVRDLPALHEIPDWLLDPIYGLLAAAGLCPHYNNDGDTVTAADASDLATLKTLVKDCSDIQVLHGLDTGIHSAADAAMDEPAGFTSSPAEPADLAECQAINNQLKADFNTHVANLTPHRALGGEGALTVALITTADGSNQATNEALANAYKAALNRHVALGLADFLID